MTKAFGLAILVCQLSACSAMGYFPTSDPDKKIQQSYQLINQGRLGMADFFLGEVTRTVEEQPDAELEAELHLAFSVLRNSEAVMQRRRFVDGRAADDNSPVLLAASDAHYQRAIDLYSDANNELGIARSMMFRGSSFFLSEENDAACELIRSGLSIYNDGKAAGRITTEPELYSPEFHTLGEAAMATICSACMAPPVTEYDICFASFE